MIDSSSFLSGQADSALAQGMTATAPSALTQGSGDTAAIKASAQSFESVFLSQMFSQMFEDVGTDSLFGGGHGEEMFRSLMIDEYAKQVSKRGGLGIADSVMRQMISQQEKKQ